MPHHMEKSLATLDELLDGSSWFPQLCAQAQQRVRTDAQTRELAAGEALSRQGAEPRHWYGVVSGLLK